MVRKLPSNSGDAVSIPGQGTQVPHATGQISRCATTREAFMPPLQSPCATNSKLSGYN